MVADPMPSGGCAVAARRGLTDAGPIARREMCGILQYCLTRPKVQISVIVTVYVRPSGNSAKSHHASASKIIKIKTHPNCKEKKGSVFVSSRSIQLLSRRYQPPRPRLSPLSSFFRTSRRPLHRAPRTPAASSNATPPGQPHARHVRCHVRACLGENPRFTEGTPTVGTLMGIPITGRVSTTDVSTTFKSEIRA